jgi:hypothetical protein
MKDMDQYPFEFKMTLWIGHYLELKAILKSMGEDWEGVVEDMDKQLSDQLKEFNQPSTGAKEKE